MITTESMNTTEKLFYSHYLKGEIVKRAEAIRLLKERDFTPLRLDFVHYAKTKSVERVLTGNDLLPTLRGLSEIQGSLPVNSTNAKVGLTDDGCVCVYWTEYSIHSEDVCRSLARCWTRDAIWKMNHQPNGKDGKNAKTLLDKLVSN